MTPQMLKAVNYHLGGMTKTDAMAKAGYKKGRAKKMDTPQLFARPDVKEEIENRKKKMAEKSNIDLEWMVERLIAIIDTSPGDLLGETGTGIDLDKMDPRLKKGLSIVDVTQHSPKGKYQRKKRTIKAQSISNGDRLRAMEMLAKLLGLMQDRIKVDAEDRLIRILQEGTDRVE